MNTPTKHKANPKTEISPRLITQVSKRLSEGKRIRRTLPDHGRLHIDRPLPFLCVYRRPPSDSDVGTDQLVKGEAAYLIAPGDERYQDSLKQLVKAVVSTMVAQFGAALVVEVWAGSDDGKSSDPAAPDVLPKFEVIAPASCDFRRTVDVLGRRLSEIRVLKQSVDVEIIAGVPCAPPGMEPVLSADEAEELGCRMLGLVVPPVYRNVDKHKEFPLLMSRFRRRVGLALRRSFYHFTVSRTTHRPPHYLELGRRAVVKAVWKVDRQLSDLSESFDFLMHVTPVNAHDAWEAFKASDYAKVPDFHYQPIAFDPSVLKRTLFAIPIERVEDPALHALFLEKQQELDRKITMLFDRDTPRFLHGSLQLYGEIEPSLLRLAEDLLDRVPGREPGSSSDGVVGAKEFAEAAELEFTYYRKLYPDFAAKAKVTRRSAGIMVSGNVLFINSGAKLRPSRVQPLLQHEIGTHLVTYFNGRAQPFRQLSTGLAGYDALQEGLAVLAEYLVGGLERDRIRQLAARVIAANQLVSGATFLETFNDLTVTHAMSPRSAFSLTMRIHRGGGLTKDVVYLRGLRQVLKHLGSGNDLETLFVGKLAAKHITVIRELLMRKVLIKPPVTPRYMTSAETQSRLDALRRPDVSVLDLGKDFMTG